MSSNPCGCDPEANHTCDGCTIAALREEVARRVSDGVELAARNLALAKRVRSLEGEFANGRDVRSHIAHLLTGRCNNCYDSLPGAVGCSVHSPGWNWVTPNFGPFCDECFKEVKGE